MLLMSQRRQEQRSYGNLTLQERFTLPHQTWPDLEKNRHSYSSEGLGEIKQKTDRLPPHAYTNIQFQMPQYKENQHGRGRRTNRIWNAKITHHMLDAFQKS